MGLMHGSTLKRPDSSDPLRWPQRNEPSREGSGRLGHWTPPEALPDIVVMMSRPLSYLRLKINQLSACRLVVSRKADHFLNRNPESIN